MTYDRGVAERLEAVFQEDLAHSGQVTYEQGQRRGLKARLFEWLVVPLRDQL